MKKIHELIAKDIFDCLSDEERKQLEKLCREKGIDAERYQQMKEEIVSRGVHEEILKVRKTKPQRGVWGMWRYAAALVLPLSVAAYLLSGSHEEVAEKEALAVQAEVPEASVERKEPKLILASGEEVYLERQEKTAQVVPNAVNKGNELVYENKGQAEPEIEYNVVVVPKGGEFQVVLSDGTKVWLNENTRLKYPVHFAGESREVYLEGGEVYLQVAKDKEHPFVMHTAGGEVKVLGTCFNVKSLGEDGMETTLVEGSVQVNSGKAVKVLVPNEQASVRKGDREIPVEVVDVEEVICWKDNVFLFKDVRLEEIMTRLSDWYGFEVVYKDHSVKDEKFYISIDKYSEVDQILKLMFEVGAVRFEILENKVVISKK